LSAKPLTNVSISIFCPAGEITAAVKLNGRENILKASFGASEIILPAPHPRAFQKFFLYRLEAQLPEKHPPAYLLFQERSAVGDGKGMDLSSTLAGDPPPLFSIEPPPAWVRELYRKTGIDLSLISLTQDTVLWENRQRSLLPFASDWMVIPRGVFRWEMAAETLSTAVPGNDPLPLVVEFFSKDHFVRQTLAWQKKETGRYEAFFENRENTVFLRIEATDLRQQNLLLQRISIRPDYLRSFQRGLIFKGPHR